MKSIISDPSEDQIRVNIPVVIAGTFAVIVVIFIIAVGILANLHSTALTAKYSSEAILKKSSESSASYKNSSLSNLQNKLVDPEGVPLQPSSQNNSK